MPAERHDVTLVRHGETEWSSAGKHTGRTDVELTRAGRDQARAVAAALDRPEDYALVLSSPLRRAWDTATLAGFGERAEPVDDLMEWDYGDWEESVTADVRGRIPGWTVWTHPIPNGESPDDVGVRADRLIERVRAADGPVVCFAHGHFLRIMCARWLGQPAAQGAGYALDTATVSILGWERETPVLRSWNRPCHL